MSKPLKRIYLGIAFLWLVYAGLVVAGHTATGENFWRSKQLWGALLMAAAFVFASRKLSQARAVNLLLLCVSLLFIEGALQIVAWIVPLPGVNTKLKCPFGRVYWTREGWGNSIRNSRGWYYPEFKTDAAHKIALIGDSFVEAVEINRYENFGVLLEKKIRADGQDTAVLAFGNHGTSPAYHMEVLDYVSRHFAPEEAVLFIYIGNDISENSPALNQIPPGQFIYYDLDPQDGLVLNPASSEIRERFIRNLEFSHRPFLQTAWMTFSSHLMTLQTIDSLRDSIALRRAQKTKFNNSADDEIAKSIRKLGLNPEVFRATPDPEAERAMSVLLKTIAACKMICDRRQIRLKVVTIPAFPPLFYETQKGSDWTRRIGDYDFQKPEQRIADFAASNGVPVLELGKFMKDKRLAVEEIQKLYFNGGCGHFTPAGHRFCADAVHETFYSKTAQPAPAS